MEEQTGKTSIKGLLQEMTGDGVEVLQGIIQSASPLKIQIVNDEKLVIGSNITYVPRHLTNYNTTCTINWGTEYKSGGSGEASFASHSHGVAGTKGITINNALQAGEKVHVLSFNHGKQYYVLDRTEG